MEPHSSCSGQSGAEAVTTWASYSSPSQYFSARIQSLSERRNDFAGQLEFEVEASKSHWTELTCATSTCGTEEEQLPNSVVFENLKEHPDWGPLFRRCPYKLEVGEKIAEGGQAEIFAASITDEIDPYQDVSSNTRSGWPWNRDLVVKVFKEDFAGGSVLQNLQRQWPTGLASAASLNEKLPGAYFSYGLCWALGAQVLEDGRFAFIFERLWGDLRKRIDERMLKSNGTPPFSLDVTYRILHSIACGMDCLHRLGVLHRDLKAANVLVPREGMVNLTCNCQAFIADFDSSVGVLGSGFWRSPEVLLALRTRNLKAETFTQESDVYSYAMICYEVITGCLPFEGHRRSDYDVVLRGDRPALPDETPSELKALVRKCWHQDPLQRPSFKEIVNDLKVMGDQLNLYTPPWYPMPSQCSPGSAYYHPG